jgi:hypothetical protein
MPTNQWQHNFLRRLVELGGSISVPNGVVNRELIELIETDYVRGCDAGRGCTYYKITTAGRAAIEQSPGEIEAGLGRSNRYDRITPKADTTKSTIPIVLRKPAPTR